MRWVAYQTAYLKTHYPVEFMAALLTSETSKPDNVVKYIAECKEMGIQVDPPDVQVSGSQFTPHITPRARPFVSAWPRSRTLAAMPSNPSSRPAPKSAAASAASGSSARRSICA